MSLLVLSCSQSNISSLDWSLPTRASLVTVAILPGKSVGRARVDASVAMKEQSGKSAARFSGNTSVAGRPGVDTSMAVKSLSGNSAGCSSRNASVAGRPGVDTSVTENSEGVYDLFANGSSLTSL